MPPGDPAPALDPRRRREPETLFDAVEQRPEPQRPQPALEPAELGDVFDAARTYSRPDRGDSESLRLTRGFEPILEAVNGGLPENQQFVDPGLWLREGGNIEGSMAGEFMRRPSRRETWNPATWVAERVTVREQMERIFAEVRRRRADDPAFLPGVPDTWREYYEQLLTRDRQERAEAASVLARNPGGFTGTAVSFAGGAREIMADPLNIATLPLGGGGAGRSLLLVAGREALINGAIEALQQPQVAENRALLGEELTGEEAAFNIGTAAAFGGAVPIVLRGAGKGISAAAQGYDWTVGRVFAAMPESVQARWAARMTVDDMPIDEFFGGLSHSDAADFARDIIGEGNLTPEQRAIVATLEVENVNGGTSPYRPGPIGDQEHGTRLSVAIQEIIDQNRPPVATSPSGRAADGGAASAVTARPGEASTSARPSIFPDADRAAVKAAIRGPESSGDDLAVNRAGSSASGRYQFIESTFKSLFRRVFAAGDEEAARAWRDRRFEPALQERLMDALIDENAAALSNAGFEPTVGNLYLAHFAGSDTAVRLLEAPPDAPVSRYFSETAIAQNEAYLGGGKSVSEAIAVIYGRVGDDSVQSRVVRAGGSDGDDPRIAELREEAQRLGEVAIGETPLASGGSLPAMRSIAVDPRTVAVDAERFQFKSGGDEFGVTERLRGVNEWNPVYAGRVVMWEDEGGQLFIADGHQRLGLARRLADQGQEIQLEGIVMRQADGVTAEDARTWAALKNIAEGTGTAADAAKVIRQVGPEVLDNLPPKSALVRDGAALSRLSDEAFGAVYNEIIAPDIAAVVGHLAPDNPAAHAGLIDLLVKLDPPNRGQAESIVRQAIAAGFHKAEQVELFGTREVTSSLFLERAKVLERGLASLRRLKGVFGVASKNADTLEGAGSKIARSKAEQEAARNAQAIEIVSRLAFSKGPVADALNSAAERLAAGAKLSDVVAEFVADVRKLELADLARTGAGDSGRLAPDGAGRGGDAGGEGQQLPGQSEDARQPSLIEMEAATERFSDPNGEAVRDQAESLAHDFKVDLSRTQVLDREGEPMVVLHGTDGEFPDRDLAVDEFGTWFAERQDTANNYREKAGGPDPRVIEARLNIERPFEVPDRIDMSQEIELGDLLDTINAKLEADGKDPVSEADVGMYAGADRGEVGTAFEFINLPEFIDAMRARGYDGMRVLELDAPTWNVFSREQVEILGRQGEDLPIEQVPPMSRRELIQEATRQLSDVERGGFKAVRPFEADEPDYWRFRHVSKDGQEITGTYTFDEAEGVIDNFSISSAEGSNSAGAAVVRQLGRQLQEQHPDATALRAYRTSGARPGEEFVDIPLRKKGEAVDPNIAAREAQELELAAASPLRGENATGQAQDGTIGLELFDRADQPGLDFEGMSFRLDDEGAEISARELLDELEADDAAIAEIKGCL